MRLIDADALIKEYCKWFHNNPEEADSTDDDIYDFIKKVEEQPMIDAQPVKHAHWIRYGAHNCSFDTKCSNCNNVFIKGFAYCPCCGAKMDEVHE